MVVSPRSICLNSNPNMMVFGGGALGRCLGCKSGALINGISILIKETQRTDWLQRKELVKNAIWDPTPEKGSGIPPPGLHQ